VVNVGNLSLGFVLMV